MKDDTSEVTVDVNCISTGFSRLLVLYQTKQSLVY